MLRSARLKYNFSFISFKLRIPTSITCTNCFPMASAFLSHCLSFKPACQSPNLWWIQWSVYTKADDEHSWGKKFAVKINDISECSLLLTGFLVLPSHSSVSDSSQIFQTLPLTFLHLMKTSFYFTSLTNSLNSLPTTKSAN